MRWVVLIPLVAALLLAAACGGSKTKGPQASQTQAEGIEINFGEPACAGLNSQASFEVLSPDSDLVSATFTTDYPAESTTEFATGGRDTGVFLLQIDGGGKTKVTIQATNVAGQSAEQTKTFEC